MIKVIEKDEHGRPTILTEESSGGKMIGWEISYQEDNPSLKAISSIKKTTSMNGHTKVERLNAEGYPLRTVQYDDRAPGNPYFDEKLRYLPKKRVEIVTKRDGKESTVLLKLAKIDKEDLGPLSCAIADEIRGKTRAEVYMEQTEGKHSDISEETPPTLGSEPDSPGLPKF